MGLVASATELVEGRDDLIAGVVQDPFSSFDVSHALQCRNSLGLYLMVRMPDHLCCA